jgi:hypothetical protein
MYKEQVRNLLITFDQYDESISNISKITFTDSEELKEALQDTFNEKQLWKLCGQFVTKAYRNNQVTLMNQLDLLVPLDTTMATLCWEDITPRLQKGVPDHLFEILAVNLEYYLQANRLPAPILSRFPILRNLNFSKPNVLKNLPTLIKVHNTSFLHMLDTAEQFQQMKVEARKQNIALSLSLTFVKTPRLFGASYNKITQKLTQKRLCDLQKLSCRVEIIEKIQQGLPYNTASLVKKFPILQEHRKTHFWKKMLTYHRPTLMKMLRMTRLYTRDPQEPIHESSKQLPLKNVVSFVQFHINDVYPQLTEYVENIHSKLYNGTGILKQKEINDLLRLYQSIHVSSSIDSSDETSSESSSDGTSSESSSDGTSSESSCDGTSSESSDGTSSESSDGTFKKD